MQKSERSGVSAAKNGCTPAPYNEKVRATCVVLVCSAAVERKCRYSTSNSLSHTGKCCVRASGQYRGRDIACLALASDLLLTMYTTERGSLEE